MDSLYELLMIHIDLLDYAKTLSFRILKLSNKGSIEELEIIVANRNRLVSIISEVQTKIEDLISQFDIRKVKNSDIEIFKSWSNDVNSWVRVVDEIDKKTLEDLEEAKEQTCKEILTVSNQKKAIGGYNLNDTKK